LVAGGVSRVGGYDVRQVLELASRTVLLAASCYVGAALGVPALLPWLPGRAFAVKGAAAGALIWGLFAVGLDGWATLDAAAWCFIMMTMASFLGLQFTGATPITSESGVRWEMRLAMPCQIAALAVGVGLFVASRLLGG
jgi:acetyl-CoA decarbonylase/synthase complex subunit gamma